MSLKRSEIENIAWLARLSLNEDEIPVFQNELEQILNLVEQMNNIDTDTILPLAHPLEICAQLREDKITETNQRAINQQTAPDVKDGYYLVPKVIE